jgi:ketosteroid isomerase-like protein
MTSDAEDVVRRYFSTVADLDSSDDDLLALLDPEARLVERPNPVRPDGATSNVEQALAGFRAGKALLSRQTLDVHEVLVCGDGAAVRTTWSGTIARDAGPYLAGTTMVSHMGGFLTVRDGRVVDHETFDRYEPFATRAASEA